MGQWQVDTQKKAGILHLVLEGTFTPDEVRAFVIAHNKAIDSYNGADYRVFCDMRSAKPFSPECATLMEEAKSYSNAKPNFRGSAVWVASTIVSMQHKRTSESAGVMQTELISADEDALWAHLQQVYRKK